MVKLFYRNALPSRLNRPTYHYYIGSRGNVSSKEISCNHVNTKLGLHFNY